MLNWLFFNPGPWTGGYYGNWSAPQQPTQRDTYTEERLHALEIACAGLWELLKQKNGFTDQELIDMIKSVDQKHASSAPTLGNADNVCPKCHHKMLTGNHTKCLWCGADLPATPFSE